MYHRFEDLREEAALIASGCVAVGAPTEPGSYPTGIRSPFNSSSSSSRGVHGPLSWEYDEALVDTRRQATVGIRGRRRGISHLNDGIAATSNSRVHSRIYSPHVSFSPSPSRGFASPSPAMFSSSRVSNQSPFSNAWNTTRSINLRCKMRSAAIGILAAMRMVQILREIRHEKRRAKSAIDGFAIGGDISMYSSSITADADVDPVKFREERRKLLSHYIVPTKPHLQRCPSEAAVAQLVIDCLVEHERLLDGAMHGYGYSNSNGNDNEDNVNEVYRPSLLELITSNSSYSSGVPGRGIRTVDVFGMGFLSRIEETMVSMSRLLVDLKAKEALFEVI
jgi:hypothetical protein